ncbi:hypothetical protein PPS11_31181 [Pseudomonas putida S11]|nr:hypothetical protein PPS11_31181 [Pseudomonas putida S11]
MFSDTTTPPTTALIRRDPHNTAVRLRAVQADHLEGLPFQRQAVAFEHLRQHQSRWLVRAHLRAPVGQLGLLGLADMGNRGGRRQHLGVREGLGQGHPGRNR